MPSATVRDPRIMCRTPTPGKAPVRIPRAKFEPVAAAILAVTPRLAPGVAFRDLPARVAEALGAANCAAIGSISWYVTTVKLELEVRGELRRLPGAPQRLIRVA
jgi:hypothetical protein